jgi:hypothetical protein
VLPGRYPPSLMAKKAIQIGACLYTRLSFWLRALQSTLMFGYIAYEVLFRIILTQAILKCGPSMQIIYLVWSLVTMAPPCYEAS